MSLSFELFTKDFKYGRANDRDMNAHFSLNIYDATFCQENTNEER